MSNSEHPFLRDIVGQQQAADSFATEAHLACGHNVILFGDTAHLVALYGRLACQCSQCLNEYVERNREAAE